MVILSLASPFISPHCSGSIASCSTRGTGSGRSLGFVVVGIFIDVLAFLDRWTGGDSRCLSGGGGNSGELT